MKPRLQSCASVFESKGNPWHGDGRSVSAPVHVPNPFTQRIDSKLKEHGLLTKGYAAEIRERFRSAENPELDQFTRARKAPLREDYRDPVPEPIGADFAKRITSARLRHKNVKPPAREIKERIRPIPPIKKAATSKAQFSVSVFRTDGSVTDHDKNGQANVDKAISWYLGRDTVTRIEVYSYRTGEIVSEWNK